MNSLLRISPILALTLGMALLVGQGVAQDKKDAKKEDKKEEKLPSIKEIMKKANAGKECLCAQAGSLLKGKEVKFEDLTKISKELVESGEQLGKNKPPKGEAASWEKLTKEYTTAAKDLLAAAEKKDDAAAKKAQGMISSSCKGCHSAHK